MRWGKQLWGEGAITLESGSDFCQMVHVAQGHLDMSSEGEGGNICWVVDR